MHDISMGKKNKNANYANDVSFLKHVEGNKKDYDDEDGFLIVTKCLKVRNAYSLLSTACRGGAQSF